MISEYRHSQSSFALEKASTNNIRGTDRKRRGLLPRNHQVTPGHRENSTSQKAPGISSSWTPRLQRRLQRLIRQNSKGNKSSEYLAYPRVLRPATKVICMYQMEMGRLYSGLQDRKYQDKREYARPIEDQHLPMSLAAWGKNQPTVQ